MPYMPTPAALPSFRQPAPAATVQPAVGGYTGLLSGIGGGGLSDWIAQHRNAITGFGTGLASGRGLSQGIAMGTQGLAQGAQADDAYATAQKAEKARTDGLAQLTTFLQSNPATADLVPLVAAGAGGEALTEAFKRMAATGPAENQYLVVGDKLVRLDGPNGPELAFDPYAGNGGVNPQEAFTRETQLSNQYLAGSPYKAYQGIRDSYEKVRSASQQKTGAGDISLIFGYMKMLDQGSTVREGEFATAQQTAGVPATIVNMYNQAISGVRLNDQQRKEFIDAAKAIYDETATNLADTNEQYSTRAQGWGIKPDNFLVRPEFYNPLQFASTVPPPIAAQPVSPTGIVPNPYGTSDGDTITLPDGTTVPVFF